MMDDDIELCFPQLLNTSCRKTKLPHTEAVLIYIVMSIITLLTLSLNLMVIISISHFKQLHTPTNLLLLSLAVSDFFVGLVMCFKILLTEGCWLLGDLMCAVFRVMSWISTAASIVTMVLISVDRYVAICDPLHYSSKITLRRAAVSCCLSWIFTVLYSLFMLTDNLIHLGRYNSCSGECHVIVINYIAALVDLILYFIVPVAVIVVLYMRVFVVAVSQARAMRSHITTVTVKSSVTVFAKKSELKAARTLGVVVVVFLSCLCPYYCFSLVGPNTLFDSVSVQVIGWLIYLNSFFNPLIYAFCYPWFIKSIKFIVTCEIFRPDSCDANIL